MSESPPKPIFSLHRSDGTVEPGLTAQEISARILDGSITEIDFVAAQGGGPRPFWQFREFAALSARTRKTGSAAAQPQPSTAGRPPISAPGATRITPALGQPSAAAVTPATSSPSRITPALGQPSSNGLPTQSRTATHPRLMARPPRLFADNLLKLRPEPFRARLLDTSPPDIVGATLEDAAEGVAAAANARIEQIHNHFSPRLFAEEDAAALEEAKTLILRTAAAMALPDRRDAIIAKAGAIGRLPLLREIEAYLPPAETAGEVVRRLTPQVQRTATAEAVNPTDSILQALESGTAVRRNLTAPDNPVRRGSEVNIPAQRASSAKAEAAPTPWGGGNMDAGARVAMGPLVAVWIGAVGTVLLSDWGRFEHQLGLLDPMNFIRIALLVGAALLSTRLLRNESLSAFGFSPAAGWNWALPLAGLLTGYLLSELWSFQYDRTAGLGAIIMVAAIRAFAEGLFFEGHVARTLFMESRTPVLGVLIAAGGSAAYMASFFDVLRSETPITPLILGFWFLFVGVPAALSMWVSRSVLIPIGFRFCAIVALYLMQSAATA